MTTSVSRRFFQNSGNTNEVANSIIFRNRVIRFIRKTATAPIEVFVDLWKIEDKEFEDVEAAKAFALEHVKNL